MGARRQAQAPVGCAPEERDTAKGLEGAMARLRALARPDQLQGMARYGMSIEHRLGVSIPELRKLAKELGRDHELALALWETGYADARILAALVDDPRAVTVEQMDAWVLGLDSWDVCDQVCMALFDKTPLAWERVRVWAGREEEYVKRAAFSLIASLAWHDKRAEDSAFVALLPVIEAAATDERNYVKKAVSWALRHIGKRNMALRGQALDMAERLRASSSRAARWVGADAARELERARETKREEG